MAASLDRLLFTVALAILGAPAAYTQPISGTISYKTNILVTNLDEYGLFNDHRKQIRIEHKFNRQMLSEVLVLDDGPDSRTVVSQRLLTSDQYQMVLDAWETRRHNFDYIRLTCWSAENRTTISNVQCYCSSFVKRNASVEDENSWSFVDAHFCGDLPHLRMGAFANLDRVKMLEFSSVSVGQAEDDVFGELIALELLYFSVTYLSPSGLRSLASSLCVGHMRNLTIFYATHTRVQDAEDRTILQIFNCPNEEQVRRSAITAITITFCNISSLTRRSFSSVNPTSLLSLDLSHNVISSIDGDTFDGFVNLLQLILTDNRLELLPTTLLHGLQSMRYLDFSRNKLDTFSTELISNSSNLNLLNLRDCRLKNINGSLCVAPQMWILHLENNLLEEIDRMTFHNCTALVVLSMKNNHIYSVDEFAFSDLFNVKKLRISQNYIWNATALRTAIHNSRLRKLIEVNFEYNRMSYLPPDFFGHVSNETTDTRALHLSYNQLTTIDVNAFRGLVRLGTLILSRNMIANLSENTFVSLIKLKKLDLCFNRIATLSSRMFLANERLEELLLHHNELLDLPENMTLPHGLRLLHIQNNRFTVVPSFDRPLQQLTLLDLSGNRLTSISRREMSRFPNITRLFLYDNMLTSLPGGVFAANGRIQELDLRRNQLELNFSIDYFSRSASSLVSLWLNDNRITSVDKLFENRAFQAVRLLDLSDNPIPLFWWKRCNQCNTTILRMRNCSLSTVPQAIVAKSNYLTELDLRENYIREFRPLILPSANYKVLLDSNPIKCSCYMRWLKDSQYSRHYRLSACYHTPTDRLVPFNTIPESEFLCRIKECPVRQCDCFKDDRNASNLPTHLLCAKRNLTYFPTNLELTIKVIDFAGNRLSEFSIKGMASKRIHVNQLYLDNNIITSLEKGAFQKFPNLETLGLTGNRLTRLNADAFLGMTRLQELLLQNNRISFVEPNVFDHLPNLVTLQLHSNELKEISDQTLDELDSLQSLTNLTLHDNPWICPCDNATFKNWILNHADAIPNNRTGIECNGTSILTRSDQDFICYDTRLHVFVKDYLKGPLSASLTAALLLLLIVFSLVLSYRHRHVLQVKLYNSRFRLRLRRPENLSCLYDAIVMYDADNDVVRQWTQEQLRPRLLQFDPQFRLFIPDLDLGLGFDELNCIVDGVTQSRRTIVVVDEGSYDNPYVLYSFKFAYHHMTTDDKLHDVLLVLTDNLDVDSLLDDDRVDANFKAFLAAGKTVTMSGRHLWEELNYFMPQSTTDVAMIPVENYEHQEWEPLLPGRG